MSGRSLPTAGGPDGGAPAPANAAADPAAASAHATMASTRFMRGVGGQSRVMKSGARGGGGVSVRSRTTQRRGMRRRGAPSHPQSPPLLDDAEQEAVLAITSGVGNMQAVLDCVWEKLLPGIGSAPTASDGQAALERKIAALAVPSPSAGPAPGPSEGVIGRTYRLDTNPLSAATARLTRGALTLTGQGKPTKLSFGFTRWVAGRAPLMGRPGVRCAGRAAWTAPDTLTIKLCFTETPYEETIACTFAGQSITVTSRLNVSFGPSEGATLRGVAE